MSAAEKLKALGERHAELVVAQPPPGENFAVDYLGPLANLSGDFARVLPQIVAVVEAAQVVGQWPPENRYDYPPLKHALAALDEALT